MINLAFCITELNIGGAERALCELAVRLDRTRFDVMVYSLMSCPENEAESCVPTLREAGIPVRFLDMRSKFSFLSGLRKLRRSLEEQRPDVFLSFLFHANLLGRLAARAAGVKRVVSGIRVAERRSTWPLRLDRWTSDRVDRYVCVSHAVAEFSRTVGGLPADKLTVIPNGVDLVAAQAAAEQSTGRENRILFVGRLDEQKGIDRLLDTLPDWLPGLPDWELWLVGDGPLRETLEQRLKSRAFEGFASRVRLTGRRNDVPDLLAASKMLILPSRWEGMPNVVLQAMAAGLPVVSTPVEGVTELLGPTASEQAIPFGPEFGRRIVTLATDPATAQRLGQENRRRVAAKFAIDDVVRRYEELFMELYQNDESHQPQA